MSSKRKEKEKEKEERTIIPWIHHLRFVPNLSLTKTTPQAELAVKLLELGELDRN